MTSKIKMTMTAAAAEQVAGNQYLLEEILVRLPTKSLARSKLVSKQWLAHISDSEFIRRHSQHSPNRFHTGMFFVTNPIRDCRNADFVAFSDDLNPTHQTIPSLGSLYDAIRQQLGVGDDEEVTKIEILNSCNGLFLLCILFWRFKCSISYYCVCNPTTKTFRLLPTGPRLERSTSLAFDPSVSLHYKVVICSSSKLYIYSSEDQLWKTIAPPFNPGNHGNSFFFRGSIYWLFPRNSLCFDVYNEEMKPLNVSPEVNLCFRTTPLAIVGSHLYFLCRESGKPTPDFRLLEMGSDFSEWVTKYDATLSPLLSAFPQIVHSRGLSFLDDQVYKSISYCFSGVCVVEGVKEDEAQLVLGIPGKLVMYNLKEKTAKELYNFPGELGPYVYSQSLILDRVFQFIETLFGV